MASWSLYVLFLIFTTNALATIVVPDGFELRRIATNLNPTAMRTAPDGRIFFCEKHGALRVIKNDILLDEPVLSITSLSTWNERGLIGITFHPDFLTNNWIYIQYTWTDGTLLKGRVSRFTLDGDVAREGETVIWETEPYSNNIGMHNGGSLVIDKSRMMFVFMGDIFNRTLAPMMDKSFGKIFRINLDGSIPEDNPYYHNLTGIYRAIWADGLRNPFMAAYNPETDQIAFGDVGEHTWEELNLLQRGAHYGWPAKEGYSTTDNYYTNPLYAFEHKNTGCAITGVVFYRNFVGAQYLFPALYHNKVFFGDYCKGWIRYVDINDNNVTVRQLIEGGIDAITPALVRGREGGVSMTQGLDGSLYFGERGTSNGDYTVNMGVLTGSVYKLIYTGNMAPVIYAPLPQWPPLPVGKTFSLRVGATGAAPLTYSWFHGDTLVPYASGDTINITMTDDLNGTRYRVEVSNANGTATSNEVVIIVSDAGLRASVWTSQSTYRPGDVIQFNVTVVDPTDDPLRLISWVIELNHQTHTHPFTTFSNIVGGNITIPLLGESDPVQSYSFWCYVQNSVIRILAGKTISPIVDKILVATNPYGLSLIADGVETRLQGTKVYSAMAYSQIVFYAPDTQSVGNITYQFIGWSDGKVENERTVEFRPNVVTITAKYCTVNVNCPAAPVADIPVTAPFHILPPVAEPIAEPITEPIAPIKWQPVSVPVAEPQPNTSTGLVPEPVVHTAQPVSASRSMITSNACKKIFPVIESILCCIVVLLFVI